MNAGKRASFSSMHVPKPANTGFKRQIVFRVNAEEWPLLEAAAAEHGSIQAAVIAALKGLATKASEPSAAKPVRRDDARSASESATPAPALKAPIPATRDPGEELTARDAAQLLGLKTSTVSGYIRSGRLAGHYDGEPSWRGWLTTRAAVDAYRSN
jgi:hypothetical protein